MRQRTGSVTVMSPRVCSPAASAESHFPIGEPESEPPRRRGAAPAGTDRVRAASVGVIMVG
eukprot:751992-Hanusia_phi.AAC.2